MPKRMTDTEKWKKPFFRSLPIEYKCFWFYLLDDCDIAGVWQIDMEVAELRLGIKLSLQKARGFFEGKVVEFDSGHKWFIPDFISFQYGSLDERNKMFKPVTSILKKYSLMGHLSPIYGGKDKDKEKDKDVLGSEKVKEVANKVWKDDIWKEQLCMGLTCTVPELKKWMALFNSSVASDAITDFNEGSYKKMLSGWIGLQKGKGRMVSTMAINQNNPIKIIG